ncbi:MAG: START-like domain-containing protein, partial [Bacteroidales bacterium]
MEREKIHLEYLLNATSKSILWTAISTPTGLEGWFADRVQSDDKIVSFFWGKTERRDAEIIAKCLAQHNYSPVHIPTAKDEETKEFLRMRDDHKLALKKVKQQILAFCLRHNYRYDGKSHWTAAHLKWLKALTPEALYKEIL